MSHLGAVRARLQARPGATAPEAGGGDSRAVAESGREQEKGAGSWSPQRRHQQQLGHKSQKQEQHGKQEWPQDGKQ
ncbi:MAG: hypothetical protein EB027_05475 [Actinobacteria bacterium]|nr:hypothetical protein [Actinomycetota bacterium]